MYQGLQNPGENLKGFKWVGIYCNRIAKELSGYKLRYRLPNYMVLL